MFASQLCKADVEIVEGGQRFAWNQPAFLVLANRNGAEQACPNQLVRNFLLHP